jgi:hypothetical protein
MFHCQNTSTNGDLFHGLEFLANVKLPVLLSLDASQCARAFSPKGFHLKVLFVIVYCFLSPSTVVIHERFEPRICDFGLSRSTALNQKPPSTFSVSGRSPIS